MRNLHFLVVDGYSKAGREDLQAGGATTAGELYRRLLHGCAPACDVDILYPADPGVALPQEAALRRYDGVCWTGSSLTVYDDTPAVQAQIAFARTVFEARVPSFGSCWAAQIAVTAAGGRCAKNPRGREMGIARKISLTAEGRAHPLFTGKKTVFDAFISHDDEITHLPNGAIVLASNDFTRVQAVSVNHRGGQFWGLQYHPEYDLHEMARLVHCRTEKLTRLGFFTGAEQARVFIDKLETLHTDPGRRDIAWELGLDDDVMDPEVRTLETRNWIEGLVIPRVLRAG